MTDQKSYHDGDPITSQHIRLPLAVAGGDIESAAADLRRYYEGKYPPKEIGTNTLAGAWFDEFDPSGTREDSQDYITSDDLVAVALLSTPIKPSSVVPILEDHKEEIHGLLKEIPKGTNLWEIKDPIDENWTAWKLETLLCRIPDIGVTIGSKLIARKRPMLYPIIDSVVRRVFETEKATLLPLYEALQDEQLRNFLVDAREEAGLPDTISVLRVLDVLAWMEGKAKSSLTNPDQSA